MNYTITFSPSIDYIIRNDRNSFNANGLTRVEKYFMYPGGKGINATYILNQLEVDNKAITFMYGKTKGLYKDLLSENKIRNIIEIDTENNLDIRINVKYFDSKNAFEVNGPSFKMSDEDLNKLKNSLANLKEGEIVFIMGKCDETVLLDLIQFIKSKKAEFVLDIDSPQLLKIIKHQPLLIKPNIDELSLILNKQFKNIDEIKRAMKELKELGAKNVIISMGKDGSLLLDESNYFYQAKTKPLSSIRSTVGCGDTLVASFIAYKYAKKLSSEKSFKKASAMSAATACEWFLAKKSVAEDFESIVSITKI